MRKAIIGAVVLAIVTAAMPTANAAVALWESIEAIPQHDCGDNGDDAVNGASWHASAGTIGRVDWRVKQTMTPGTGPGITTYRFFTTEHETRDENFNACTHSSICMLEVKLQRLDTVTAEWVLVDESETICDAALNCSNDIIHAVSGDVSVDGELGSEDYNAAGEYMDGCGGNGRDDWVDGATPGDQGDAGEFNAREGYGVCNWAYPEGAGSTLDFSVDPQDYDGDGNEDDGVNFGCTADNGSISGDLYTGFV